MVKPCCWTCLNLIQKFQGPFCNFLLPSLLSTVAMALAPCPIAGRAALAAVACGRLEGDRDAHLPPLPALPLSPLSRCCSAWGTLDRAVAAAVVVELPVEYGRPEANRRRHLLRLAEPRLPAEGIGLGSPKSSPRRRLPPPGPTADRHDCRRLRPPLPPTCSLTHPW